MQIQKGQYILEVSGYFQGTPFHVLGRIKVDAVVLAPSTRDSRSGGIAQVGTANLHNETANMFLQESPEGTRIEFTSEYDQFHAKKFYADQRADGTIVLSGTGEDIGVFGAHGTITRAL